MSETYLISCLESARDNIKKVLDRNPSKFAVSSSQLLSPTDILQKAKILQSQQQSKTTMQIATESYLNDLSLSDSERSALKTLLD